MNHKLRIVTVAVLCLLFCIPLGLAQRRSQPMDSEQREGYPQAQPPLQHGRPLYQRRDSWYEFLLKQFNPDNFNYGIWMEQRRQGFLEARARNPYFGYSLGVTVTLLLVTVVSAKLWIDHRRAMWVTAEMMTDLYNHDLYSRRFARDAIQKYNDHIERCNRAIEAAEHGTPIHGENSDVDRLRRELQSVAEERDSYKRERDLCKNDLTEKERLLADMSLRLDALARKSDSIRNVSSPIDTRTADQKLVHHINNLQEQLYVERRENKRLKGA